MISKNQIKLIRSLELKKNRRRENLFVAEGPKVVGDLLQAGYVPHSIFSTTVQPDAQLITDEELRRISFLQHPQEVLALFEIPTADSQKLTANSQQLSLALDGVQDPGNVGTIIRIADWFGIDTIYCSPDTADVYNPKVVQATMGRRTSTNSPSPLTASSLWATRATAFPRPSASISPTVYSSLTTTRATTPLKASTWP